MANFFSNRSLKTQLVVSHFVLVLLMVVVMAGAIINFFSLGRSIDRIFRNNYKSVVAAQQMKDSLERMDSSVTFLLAGQRGRAQGQYRENRRRFLQAYGVAAHNITERGEGEMTSEIGGRFESYCGDIERMLFAAPPMPLKKADAYYFHTLEPAFIDLKQRAQNVLDLNQAAIITADVRAKAEATSASWRSIAVTAGAFLMALFFAVRMIGAILTPILTLSSEAEEIGAGNLDQHIEVRRSDEIGTLADSFNRMAAGLREARKIQEHQLHLAQRMSDAALTSLYDPVIVTDSNGRILNLNRAAQGIYGSMEKLGGAQVADVVPQEEIIQELESALADCVQEERASEPERVQIEVGTATRTYYPRATSMKDEDGTMLGAVVVLEDVTYLTQLDRMKTEFISVASHEMRTPVASLMLASQLLGEGAVGKLTPEQQAVAKSQFEDLQRLDRLMTDLLDISKLELGTIPPRFEIVRAEDLAQSAVRSMSAQAGAKGVGISVEADDSTLAVRADRSQISRALINLLANAIRHTPKGGLVTVRVKRVGEKVGFEVEDTGTGIPSDYLTRIFEKFVQVPGATSGGAGMGLSIAQSIVKTHGGEIAVESELGKGSKFRFELTAAA